jgi:hypothetical protein
MSTRLHGFTSEKIAVFLDTSIRISCVTQYTDVTYISVLSSVQQHGYEANSIHSSPPLCLMGQNCYEDLDVDGKTIMAWVLRQYVFMLLRT